MIAPEESGTVLAAGRQGIYYWKCDRPSAFHGIRADRNTDGIDAQLRSAIQPLFPGLPIQLRDGGGQGNHLTWIAEISGQKFFVRVENGPEKDGQLEVETYVMNRVRQCGVRTPRVHHVDTERRTVPFAWQLMDLIECKDLNYFHKQGQLDAVEIAFEIGQAIAQWQSVDVTGFGHFDPRVLRASGKLQGFHSTYPDYFLLNWDRHLRFLVKAQFLSRDEAGWIDKVVTEHRELLELTKGCLVHKDLAFWNILGDARGVVAYIDWDDAVSADEADDLSLLGCFHDGAVIARATQGYQSIAPLPEEFTGRFWLHMIRNMVVKSVIRAGAGYFQRSDSFYLISPGSTGESFAQQTRTRLFRAVEGLLSLDAPENL